MPTIDGCLLALASDTGAYMKPFTSPLGLPCQAPPCGLVPDAELTSSRIAWQHPNGTVRDLSPVPLPFRMGVPNLGGAIVTAGRLATPMDYVGADGRQYVLVVAGGHGSLGTKAGD